MLTADMPATTHTIMPEFDKIALSDATRPSDTSWKFVAQLARARPE